MNDQTHDDLGALNFANELAHQREVEAGSLRADPAYPERLDKLNRNTNMNLDELVAGKSEYFRKEDTTEAGINLTIKGFKRVTVKGDDGEEAKVAMYFTEENTKPLLLNITNKNRLKAATGASTTEEVKGKVINVYNDPYVEFAGKVVGGVRIRAATNKTTTNAAGNFDDDIPF